VATITGMLDPGTPLDEVQRLAGRADLRTTTRLRPGAEENDAECHTAAIGIDLRGVMPLSPAMVCGLGDADSPAEVGDRQALGQAADGSLHQTIQFVGSPSLAHWSFRFKFTEGLSFQVDQFMGSRSTYQMLREAVQPRRGVGPRPFSLMHSKKVVDDRVRPLTVAPQQASKPSPPTLRSDRPYGDLPLDMNL